MKKEYSKPTMRAYQMKPANIICTSSNVMTTSTSAAPYQDSNNTFVNGMSGGIWNSTNNPD